MVFARQITKWEIQLTAHILPPASAAILMQEFVPNPMEKLNLFETKKLGFQNVYNINLHY